MAQPNLAIESALEQFRKDTGLALAFINDYHVGKTFATIVIENGPSGMDAVFIYRNMGNNEWTKVHVES